MANPDAANILVAKPLATGGVLTAAANTAIPASAAASTAAYTAAGYIGEDGVTMTIERETEDIFAWGGDKVRVIQTSHSVQIQIPFLEANPAVFALVFGEDNVETVGTETTIHLNGTELPHFALVIDTADGDKRARICASDAQVIEQEDIVFVHTAPTQFNVTIEIFPDDAGEKGVIYYDTGDGS